MWKKVMNIMSTNEQTGNNESINDNKKTIVDIMKSYINSLNINGIHIDDIPLKKLNNVKKAYGLKTDDEVYLLMDTTILQSGKDGLILTDKYIGMKKAFQKPVLFTMKEICQSAFNIENLLIKNEREYFCATKVEFEIVLKLRQVLIENISQMASYYREKIDSLENTVSGKYSQADYLGCIEVINNFTNYYLSEKEKIKLKKILFQSYISNFEFVNAKSVIDWMKELSENFDDMDEEYNSKIKGHILEQIENYRSEVDRENFTPAKILREKLFELVELYPDKDLICEIKSIHTREEHYMNQEKLNRYINANEYKKALEILENENGIGYLNQGQIEEQKTEINSLRDILIENQRMKLNDFLDSNDFANAEIIFNELVRNSDKKNYFKQYSEIELSKGNIRKIEELIDESSDSRELNLDIQKRIIAHSLEMLAKKNFEYFIENPTYVPLQDKYGMTIVHYAVILDEYEKFKILFKHLTYNSKTFLNHDVIDLISKSVKMNELLKVIDEDYSNLVTTSTKVDFSERALKVWGFLAPSDDQIARTVVQGKGSFEAGYKFSDLNHSAEDKVREKELIREQAKRDVEKYFTKEYYETEARYITKVYNFLQNSNGIKSVTDDGDNKDDIDHQINKLIKELKDLQENSAKDYQTTEEFIKMYNEYKNELSKEISGQKDEFETTSMYKERVSDAINNIEITHFEKLNLYKNKILNEFLELNKQKCVDIVTKLRMLRIKENSLMMEQFFIKSYQKDSMFLREYFNFGHLRLEKSMDLKNYDADNEVFEIGYGKKLGLIKVPLTDAKQFKENFEVLPKDINYQLSETQLVIVVYIKYQETDLEATFKFPV